MENAEIILTVKYRITRWKICLGVTLSTKNPSRTGLGTGPTTWEREESKVLAGIESVSVVM
jgi:hypothetical protein